MAREGWVLTWVFARREIATGALQAIGSILVYALVVWIIINKYVNVSYLRDAIAMRAPSLVAASSSSSSSSASASEVVPATTAAGTSMVFTRGGGQDWT